MSRFVVDPEGSRLRALARSSVHPFSYQAPLTGTVDAGIQNGAFDLGTPITGALEVDLDTLRGDDPHTDSEMHRRLDTQRYPRAKAAVRNVSHNGSTDTYRLTGELTLHGQTQPLEGDATVTLTGNRLHATGSLTIDIRDFGIKPPSLLLVRVHPQIEIIIDLQASLDGVEE